MPTHLMLKGAFLGTQNPAVEVVETLRLLAQSGVHIVETYPENLTHDVLKTIQYCRLGLIVRVHAEADIISSITLAKQAKAIAVHIDGLPSVATATEIIALAADAGMPLRFLLSGAANHSMYLDESLKSHAFVLDVSSFVPLDLTHPALNNEWITGRVEAIIGRLGKEDVVDEQKLLWAECMRLWRLRKPAGSSFLVTFDTKGLSGISLDELQNRFEQETAMTWEIAKDSWKISATSGRNRCWP